MCHFSALFYLVHILLLVFFFCSCDKALTITGIVILVVATRFHFLIIKLHPLHSLKNIQLQVVFSGLLTQSIVLE